MPRPIRLGAVCYGRHLNREAAPEQVGGDAPQMTAVAAMRKMVNGS